MSAKPRILLVGPLPLEGTPIGGTQVSFADLVRRVRASGRLECEVVDTSRHIAGQHGWSRAPADVRALTATLRAIARVGPSCDAVLFNASSGGSLKAGPFIWAAARGIHRPFGLRVFGGDLDLRLANAPLWRRSAAERTCLAAPLVLLQTRHLCRTFQRFPGVRWLPTTRDLDAVPRTGSNHCTRFLFLSQIKHEKGLCEALAASDRLPAHGSLTLYGPTIPGAHFVGDHPRATFAGSVRSVDLPRVLAEHDALIFPSWYEGEGMPGAVIEAMQAGMPVIASNWRSLPELVIDGRNGLLVPPRDVDALANAMLRLESDPELYAMLAYEARMTGERFRGPPWHEQLETSLELLARDGRADSEPTDMAA